MRSSLTKRRLIMLRRFPFIIMAMGIMMWISPNMAGDARAADMNLGFKARITSDALIVTGNGVAQEASRNLTEANQTAQVAAMIDALRNLGETVRIEKELMKKSLKQMTHADERQYAQSTKLFLPLYKTIKTTCSTAASTDGKSRYDRCTFDYGRYRLQSSTDMQSNTIVTDIITFRTLEHTIKIVDFALATSACSDMAEILPAIIGKLGLQLNTRQLPDGSAEVDLIYKRGSKGL
jgi:hypothetical protein